MKLLLNETYFVLFSNKKNYEKKINKLRKYINNKSIIKIYYNKKNIFLFDKYEIDIFPTLIIFKNGLILEKLICNEISKNNYRLSKYIRI